MLNDEDVDARGRQLIALLSAEMGRFKMSTREAAQRLGVTSSTAHKWLAKGEPPTRFKDVANVTSLVERLRSIEDPAGMSGGGHKARRARDRVLGE